MSLRRNPRENRRDDRQRRHQKISDLSKESKRNMTDKYRKAYNLTRSRKIAETPAHLMSLHLLGHDPEENLMQKEYDNYAERKEVGRKLYIPYNKAETNRTGKLSRLLLDLQNYIDPNEFTKDFKGYDKEIMHWHLYQSKKMGCHGLVNFKWDVLGQNIMARTAAESAVLMDILYALMPQIVSVMDPELAESNEQFDLLMTTIKRVFDYFETTLITQAKVLAQPTKRFAQNKML